MEFTFATAGSIQFASGSAWRLGEAVEGLGSRVMLVTGSHPERVAPIVDGLPVVARHELAAEPTMDDARRAIAAAREAQADVVVGIGGGSVVDLAKAVGALAVEGSDPIAHAEVIGEGLPLPLRTLPVVAVPTTAGTGAEVTRNAVLTSSEHGVKVSLRGPSMLPRLAIIDPELTLDCPPEVTAASGMDALVQCLEPFVSPMATPLTDGFCRTGLAAASRSLRTAYADGSDLEARTDMALCSLMGGLALANSKLGAVHGLAGVLGGVTGAAHGAICASVLPSVTAANVVALRSRDPENPALDRYAEAAEIVCGVREPEALIGWVEELVRFLDIASLSDLGLDESQVDEVAEKASRSSSMRGNPVVLNPAELAFVVRSSM